jgi:hypothetical protein
MNEILLKEKQQKESQIKQQEKVRKQEDDNQRFSPIERERYSDYSDNEDSYDSDHNPYKNILKSFLRIVSFSLEMLSQTALDLLTLLDMLMNREREIFRLL